MLTHTGEGSASQSIASNARNSLTNLEIITTYPASLSPVKLCIKLTITTFFLHYLFSSDHLRPTMIWTFISSMDNNKVGFLNTIADNTSQRCLCIMLWTSFGAFITTLFYLCVYLFMPYLFLSRTEDDFKDIQKLTKWQNRTKKKRKKKETFPCH
jgi:hypothetical protein